MDNVFVVRAEPRHLPTGFSLLELIVTLALISILAGMVAPMFGASISTVQFRNAQNDLVALLQFTQELAVRDSREYRLYIDKKSGEYWVEGMAQRDGAYKVFEPVKQAWGEHRTLPPYVAITALKARKDRGGKNAYIGCYPNGASDEASIALADTRTRSRKVEIEITGPLGQVNLVTGAKHVVTK